MSMSGIEDSLFNATITLQRRVETFDDTGDSVQFNTNLLTDIRASIQPIRISEYQEAQGLDYEGMYNIYANIDSFTANPPKNHDFILDEATSEVYQIMAVEKNLSGTSSHHYKFVGKKQELNS